MDFAKKQLLKYGWTEGSGLGKNETGISEPIKPKLKFDTAGIGHNLSEQFTNNWWENVYNNAASNISVVESKSGSVNVKRNSEESVNITSKKYSIKSSDKSKLQYGSFFKSATLTTEGMVECDDKMVIDEPVEKNVQPMTDEELFAVCEGRTAHKGARHGLKLSGKLARIEKQEKEILKRLMGISKDFDAQTSNTNETKDDDSTVEETKSLKKSNIKKFDSDENLEYKKKKKSKKRCYSDDDEQVLEEKKKHKSAHKKQERKKVSAIANMFENACVIDPQENNKDDGFDESSKGDCKILDGVLKGEKRMRKKMKKAKKNKDLNQSVEDDGFEECINEVNEKLIFYKELRKDLQAQKQKGDERRINKMSEEFAATL